MMSLDTANERDRRLKRFIVRNEDRARLFETHTSVSTGLPDDARFIRRHERPARRADEYVFRSDEFDVVPEGGVVPEQVIELDADGEGPIGDPDSKQAKLVRISDQALSLLLREDVYIERGIPLGSHFVDQWHCADKMVNEVMLKHEDFEHVGEADLPPTADIDFARRDKSVTGYLRGDQ